MDAESRELLKAFEARMAKSLDKLSSEMARTSAELRALGGRMDKYAAAVVRGFTAGVGRDHALETRLGTVEKRLGALERRRRG